jgi:hypothetical protein
VSRLEAVEPGRRRRSEEKKLRIVVESFTVPAAGRVDGSSAWDLAVAAHRVLAGLEGGCWVALLGLSGGAGGVSAAQPALTARAWVSSKRDAR